MRLITIKVTEDNERNTVEAKVECDFAKGGGTELETFTADQLVKGIYFVINSGGFMPEALATGFGPNCDAQTEIQLDILKAGRKP